MNILITGAAGFVGKNLAAALAAIRDGKDKTHPSLSVEEIYLYDIDTPKEKLAEFCQKAHFVYHLAGVNRPQDPKEFMEGNFGFTDTLLSALRKANNPCPILLSSSIQACCVGRYDGEYGRSKREGENLLFAYGEETGAPVFVYRFPNLFGKWCRPNYNSVIATFCHNVAHDLPITVNDEKTELTLLYIDDLVAELLAAAEGKPSRCRMEGLLAIPDEGGAYCVAPITHKVTLGEIVSLLNAFKDAPGTLMMPKIPEGSFAKKLYSTYLSYLPADKVRYPLKQNADARGSFTELLKTPECGQFSVNVSLPGITKGQHWHHTKWEIFVVVSGHGLIQMRRIGAEEVLEFEVFGEKPEAVQMLPGYTHNIINLSETEPLVTFMWANECFDPTKPDTFFEPV